VKRHAGGPSARRREAPRRQGRLSRGDRWRILAAILGLLSIGIVVLLWRRERPWTLHVTASQDTTSPWTGVDLVAEVKPAPEDPKQWVWKWSATPSADLDGSGPSIHFRSGAAGEYRVTVTARSPRGTERSAETTVRVQVPQFQVGLGTKGPARDDPFPDTSRPDLPFRITRVTVDKPEVCRGERTVIRVEAQDDQGNADMLVPTIAGKVGWIASVVVPGDAPGPYKIPVRLGDPDRGDRTQELKDFQQTGAFVTLKDCDAPRALLVTFKQHTSVEEDAKFHATVVGAGAAAAASGAPTPPTPSAFRWDFGDGSGLVTTKGPDAWHLFPDEEQRGPRKRVFSYLVKAEALDGAGKPLLNGSTAFYVRNRLEELKKTDHRLQLLVVFHPEPVVDADGSRHIDVVLKNLDVDETAHLDALQFRRAKCGGVGVTPDERHSVGDVFGESVVRPRESIHGQLRWPKDGPDDVCHLNVSIEGTSQPGGLTVGGGFSMRTGFDDGAQAAADPAQSAAIKKAMEMLHKSYVTQQDLEGLVQSGDLPSSVLRIPSKPSRGAPTPPGASAPP
jgi:hypothetical protein